MAADPDAGLGSCLTRLRAHRVWIGDCLLFREKRELWNFVPQSCAVPRKGWRSGDRQFGGKERGWLMRTERKTSLGSSIAGIGNEDRLLTAEGHTLEKGVVADVEISDQSFQGARPSAKVTTRKKRVTCCMTSRRRSPRADCPGLDTQKASVA